MMGLTKEAMFESMLESLLNQQSMREVAEDRFQLLTEAVRSSMDHVHEGRVRVVDDAHAKISKLLERCHGLERQNSSLQEELMKLKVVQCLRSG